MKTVPLYGAKAAERVALVDDEDYDLAMVFRWNVWEARRPNGVIDGPYARTCLQRGGKKFTLRLHSLVTGYPQVDHINHNTLDDQRFNLRPATTAQNIANQRSQAGATSQYKGVCWYPNSNKWLAAINAAGGRKSLGYFDDESEAGRAYDTAALAAWGDYAFLNFPAEVPVAVAQRQRAAERLAYEAERLALIAEMTAIAPTSAREWWSQRQPETRTCVECGNEYQSRSTHPSLRCSDLCRSRAAWRRRKERMEAAEGCG